MLRSWQIEKPQIIQYLHLYSFYSTNNDDTFYRFSLIRVSFYVKPIIRLLVLLYKIVISCIDLEVNFNYLGSGSDERRRQRNREASRRYRERARSNPELLRRMREQQNARQKKYYARLRQRKQSSTSSLVKIFSMKEYCSL